MNSTLIIRSPFHPTRRCGIRLKNRATRFLSRIFRRRRRRYPGKVNAALRTFRCWAGKFLRFRPGSYSGYARLDRVQDEVRSEEVPKGHLAVYVGRKDEGLAAERVVVPVVYINHPLFARLLVAAEEKYGFDHPGGITIPCHVSEFQSIKSLIAAGRNRNRLKL